MNYSVGDEILCNIEVFHNGDKKISIREPQKNSVIEVMTFPIVSVDETTQTYKVIVPNDVSGWIISKFHIQFQHVSDKFMGKRFYDIAESLVLDKVKKK